MASTTAYNVSATLGSSTVNFALTNTTGPAATASISSGNYQSTAVNSSTTLPLTVLVTDSKGNPVSGVAVAFVSSSTGRGTVTASVTTGSNGLASSPVTAGATQGAYTVTATPTGLTAVVFNLSTSNMNGSTLTLSAGSPQTAGINAAFGTALSATVTNTGVPVANALVLFTAPSSGASTNPATFTALTNTSGVATVTATAGSVAGAYAVVGSVSKVSSTISYSLTNTASSTAAAVTVSAGNNQSTTVGTSFAAITAKVTDSGGNPLSGQSVTFTAQGTTANATGLPVTVTTNSSGLASTTPGANSIAGNYTVAATVTGATSASFNLTNTAAAGTKVAVASGGTQSTVVNTPFGAPLVAQVTDASGNAAPVAGVVVTFTIVPSAGATTRLSSLTASTNSSGQASVAATAGTVTGSYSVTASISGGTATGSFALTNTPGAAVGVTPVAGSTPQSQTVNLAFTALTAQVVDAFGNAVPGSGVVVSYAAPSSAGVASAGLAAATALTNASGVASMGATANTVTGSYSVTASISGGPTTATYALTNTPGAAAKAAVASGSPQSQAVGVAFASPLVVQVLDAYNNAVGAGITVSYATPASPNATLGSTTALTNASGQASIGAAAGLLVGSYTVTATVPSGTQSALFSLQNTVGPAANVTVLSGTPQNQNVNVNFAALTAQITDAYGNAVGAGITVNLAAPSSAGVPTAVVPATTTTDSTGKISFTATAGTVAGGPYNVTAAVPSGTTSATFALTNLPGAPYEVDVVSGGPQSQTANVAFAQPLVAQVVDSYGNLVGAGVTVSFAPPTGAGVATATVPATAVTNSSSQVSVSATAGLVAGAYSVSATVSGGSVAASFALTNTAATAAQVSVVSGSPQSKAVGVAFDNPLVVQVQDAYNNPVGAGITVSYATPASPNATLASTTALTNSAGQASMSATAGLQVGSYSVVATVPSGTQSASFSLQNTVGPAANVAVLGGTPQNQNANVNFSALTAQITDAYGNAVGAGVTVNLTAPSGAGVPTAVVPATATTDSSGQISFTAKAGTVAGGPYNVTAAVPSGTTSATFALTNLPGAPYEVDVVSGGPQSQTANVAFAQPLVAQVVDSYGNLVGAGVTVSFAPPTGAGVATATVPATAVTNSSSQVSVSATAGLVAGAYSVSASVSGGSVAASFSLTNTAATAAQVSVVSGSPQSKAVGVAFDNPLVVQVQDAYNNPVGAGITVTYATPASPNATLGSTTALTDSSGQASISATAGLQVGSYSVVATVPSGTQSASFSLQNMVGPAANVAVLSGTPQNQNANVNFAALTAQVTDAYGNPVGAGISVNLTAPSGAGVPTAVVPATTSTDSSGQISFTAKAGTVAGGPYNVTAAVPSGTTSATFALTNLPGAPYEVDAVSGGGQSQTAHVAFAQPLVAQVVDAFGNLVGAGVTVSFAPPTAGTGVATATVSATAVTDASSQVSVSATAGLVAGTYSVSATVSGGSLAASFSLTNTAGLPVAVSVVSGDAQSKAVGVAFDSALVAQVADAYGNAVGANVLVTFTPPSGTGVATASLPSPNNANTNSAGQATLAATAGTVVGAYTVTAAVAGGTSQATFNLTNTVGPSAQVSVVSGSPQSAAVGGAYASLVVQVSDAYGNPAGAGTGVTFTPPASEPTASLSATTGSTNSSGQVSVGATAGHKTGTVQVTASLSGGASVTFALTNTPGTATQVAVLSGQAQSQNVTLAFANPLVAQVTDAYGNPVGANVAVNWTLPLSGASASVAPNPGATDVSGQVSATATAGSQIGTYTATAAVSGGTQTASFGLTNTSGAVASIAVVSGSGQSAVANIAFTHPLVVQVSDAQGNPVSGATITFTPPATAPSASLGALTGVSDASGQVSVNATAGTQAGSYTVSATALGASAPATFSLTNTPAAAAALAVISGNDQNTMVTQAFASVVVQVTDAFANAVPGATVTIQAPSSGAGASLSATPAATDATGDTSLTLNANSVTGSYTVNVSTSGVSAPAALRLSNTAGAAASIALQSGNSQQAIVGTAFAAALGVQVLDAYGNPVPGVNVSASVPSSGATAVQSGSPLSTDANGVTGVLFTAGTVPGSYTVTLTAPGVTPAAAFSLTNVVGAPAVLTAQSGDNQSPVVHTAFGAPLVVLVADAYGNPVANANVILAGPSSGASTAPASSTAVSDANGLVSLAAVANDAAGSYSITATCGAAPSMTFSATNQAGAVAQATPLSGSAQSVTVGSALSNLVLQVTDTYGNPVPNLVMNLAVPSSGAGAQLASATATTDAQGKITVQPTANTILGTYSITATAAGSSISGSWTVTNTAAAAAVLAVKTGDNQSVLLNSALGSALVVRVSDVYNNPVAGVSVTFTLPSSGATLVPGSPSATVSTTNAGGLASLTGSANGTPGTYSVSVAASGVTSTVSFTVNNVATGALTVSAVSGDAQSAAVNSAFAQPLVVQVLDPGNAPAVGALLHFATHGVPISLAAQALSTDANGKVSLSVSALTSAGATQVTASLGSQSVTFNLRTTPGPVVALVPDAAAGTQASTQGQPFAQPLGLTAVDAWGNPVCCIAITFAAPTSGATAQLSGTSVTADANGHVQVQATAGSVAGSYAVTATLAGAGSATASYTLTNLSGAAAILRAVQGDGSSATVHSAFAVPLQVQLVDANGQPLSGVAISFAAPASGATAALSGAVVTTDAQGNAQVLATASDKAGTYSVTVSAVGSSAPLVLNLTNTPDGVAAAAVDPASGTQSATLGDAFVNPLGVTLVDAYGNPVPGVGVTFSAPGSGATATLPAVVTVTTDAQGHAQIAATAGSVSGSYTVSAQVTGLATAVVWSLNNLNSGANILLSTGPTTQSTPVGSAFISLVVLVQDSLGGPVPGAEVDFAGPPSGAGASFAASLTADANGQVILPITANNLAGSYTVTATTPSGSTPLAFTLTNTEAAATQLLVASSSSPQSVGVNSPYGVALQVQVLDAQGNPVVGAVVQFSLPSSGPTVQLSATSVTTDAQGYAQVVAIAGPTAGAVTVTVSVVSTALTATLSLTNLQDTGANNGGGTGSGGTGSGGTGSGGADTLALLSGGGQSAVGTHAFANPLVFVLQGSDGVAHAGVTVTFVAAPAGLSLAAASAVTNAAGQVQVLATAGSVVGNFTVTASAPNTAAPASASLTVQAIPTTTTLALSKDTLDPGESVLLTASVQASDTPRGQVEFYVDGAHVGTVACDSSGQASLSRGAPNPGKHTGAAVFVPNAPFGASQSAVATVTVTDWVISGGGCSVGGGASLLWLALGAAVHALRRRRAAQL